MHPLDPLLKPQRIALIGVSEKQNSPGQILSKMLLESDYAGEVFFINPRYTTLRGQPCYPDLNSLPATVEHVVIALGNRHLESAMQSVIDHGAKAATIYSSGTLAQDINPPLKLRMRKMATDNGIVICGINGMGFYNVTHNLHVGIFPRPGPVTKGNITYIAQSGSAFTSLCHNGNSLGFNLCVSTGDEITTDVAQYLDWSLDQPDTHVVALFLETIRKPDAFIAALEKAAIRKIPVVTLKIGKSPMGASMALTHTGAIAGNHAVLQAVFKRYGVVEVDDLDQMTALLNFLQSNPQRVPGLLAAMFESGGFRELVADRAYAHQVAFADLQESTIERLKNNLDPGLKPENPLDAWGTQVHFKERFLACLEALMSDDNVSMGVFFTNFRDDYYLSESIFEVVMSVAQTTAKPIVMATCYSDLANSDMSRRAFEAGIPLIEGIDNTMVVFKYWQSGPPVFAADIRKPNISIEEDAVKRWVNWIEYKSHRALTEPESMQFLSEFGISVVEHSAINSVDELNRISPSFKYPVVLKTASVDIHHKSDEQGVVLDIQSLEELRQYYIDINQRLGPDALVAPMIRGGVEISLGILVDPDFGPMIMVSAGGLLMELLNDKQSALCPIGRTEADNMLSSLRVDRLLRGYRGKPANDRDALISMMVSLSEVAICFADSLAEIDVNPVIVTESGAIAVDALVVTKLSRG